MEYPTNLFKFTPLILNIVIDNEERRLLRIVSKRLVQAREEASLSQIEVASFGIVSQSYLSKIENGNVKISFTTLVLLAKVYSKNLDFFNPYR